LFNKVLIDPHQTPNGARGFAERYAEYDANKCTIPASKYDSLLSPMFPLKNELE
jgi:hypothetical protein